MISTVYIALLCTGVALGQHICQEDGFFRDPQQCDKYYDCYRGEATEKLCPDGLVFDDSLGPKVEQCNYPFIVACPEGSLLQPAQPSGVECPRQNGYFEHEDPSVCDEYYQCTYGLPEVRRCHSGLVFDEFTGTCQWEHTGIRTGCGVRQEVLSNGFRCPNETQFASNGHELAHTRYPNDNDCRLFYVCFNKVHPTESGCPEGTVFHIETLNCEAPEIVPGCENYYEATNVGGSLARRK